jgi:arginyl-tRNA synthetase
MTLFTKFAAHVDHALDALVNIGSLASDLDRANVTVEPPRDASHGDLSTNAAMVLAKPAGTNPRALAEALD